MMDQHFDRGYQAGREELHAGIDALLRRLVTNLTVVFDASPHPILRALGQSPPPLRLRRPDPGLPAGVHSFFSLVRPELVEGPPSPLPFVPSEVERPSPSDPDRDQE